MHDLSGALTAPLPGWRKQTIGGVDLTLAPSARRTILRGEAACAAASRAFGVDLPRTPLCVQHRDGKAALWLGPDEWLLIEEGDTDTANVATDLMAALVGIPSSLVDVSHRQIGLHVAGPGAALLLNTFIVLDLSLAVFPTGTAARTIFDKAEIVLWRRADEMFQIEVWRSFAPYVSGLLETAAQEA
jgi:sarcosine oxidase, subunit gamma